MLVALCLLSLIAIILTGTPDTLLGTGARTEDLLSALSRTLLGFAIGMLLFRLTKAMSRRPSLLALVPLVGVLVILLLPKHIPFLEVGSVVIVFPALLLLAIRLEPPAILQSAFVVLGDISYPMYMIHVPLIAPLVMVFDKLGLPLMLYPWLFLALVAVAAYILVIWYDEPVRRFLRARDPSRRQAAPVAS
ncbi:acyltransferase family protein [Aurantiacibacter rhizosphaerae]|uniref:acyltransferase family protein n=1 Tax=Aurantiacibacter rhizosphaerae TaxID=2691582 RepID=UPI001F017BAB|nr:acyltransferase family protein [Aurantiacibacter rhizosphaerae]